MRVGSTVYHVANPEVPGRVIGYRRGNWVDVVFEESVGFSGNPCGLREEWTCSVDLLYPTRSEATANCLYRKVPSEGILVVFGGAAC